MSKKAFDKIAAGLNEAIAIARGEAKPALVRRASGDRLTRPVAAK